MSKLLHQTVYTHVACMWPWLGPSLATTLQYVFTSGFVDDFS